MSNKYIQLAFDGEKSEKTAIDTGIPQGSPVSPILFLIYIRFLFEETNNIKIRIPNYLDDIAILAKSESLENNYQILENTAKKLIQ
jgi:retron-type reverse transcriptase